MTHKDEIFEDRQVLLDGNEYDRCKFNRCELVYSGGTPPAFTNNRIENCKWTFDGAASRTINFIASLYGGGGQQQIEETFDQIRGKPAAGAKGH